MFKNKFYLKLQIAFIGSAVAIGAYSCAGTKVNSKKVVKEASNVINVNKANPLKPTFTSFDDTTPKGMVWEKVEALSDDFDTWNPKKWRKTNWNYGGTPVNMVNTNSGVKDGNLWIKATWIKHQKNNGLKRLEYDLKHQSNFQCIQSVESKRLTYQRSIHSG